MRKRDFYTKKDDCYTNNNHLATSIFNCSPAIKLRGIISVKSYIFKRKLMSFIIVRARRVKTSKVHITNEFLERLNISKDTEDLMYMRFCDRLIINLNYSENSIKPFEIRFDFDIPKRKQGGGR